MANNKILDAIQQKLDSTNNDLGMGRVGDEAGIQNLTQDLKEVVQWVQEAQKSGQDLAAVFKNINEVAHSIQQASPGFFAISQDQTNQLRSVLDVLVQISKTDVTSVFNDLSNKLPTLTQVADSLKTVAQGTAQLDQNAKAAADNLQKIAQDIQKIDFKNIVNGNLSGDALKDEVDKLLNFRNQFEKIVQDFPNIIKNAKIDDGTKQFFENLVDTFSKFGIAFKTNVTDKLADVGNNQAVNGLNVLMQALGGLRSELEAPIQNNFSEDIIKYLMGTSSYTNALVENVSKITTAKDELDRARQGINGAIGNMIFNQSDVAQVVTNVDTVINKLNELRNATTTINGAGGSSDALNRINNQVQNDLQTILNSLKLTNNTTISGNHAEIQNAINQVTNHLINVTMQSTMQQHMAPSDFGAIMSHFNQGANHNYYDHMLGSMRYAPMNDLSAMARAFNLQSGFGSVFGLVNRGNAAASMQEFFNSQAVNHNSSTRDRGNIENVWRELGKQGLSEQEILSNSNFQQLLREYGNSLMQEMRGTMSRVSPSKVNYSNLDDDTKRVLKTLTSNLDVSQGQAANISQLVTLMKDNGVNVTHDLDQMVQELSNVQGQAGGWSTAMGYARNGIPTSTTGRISSAFNAFTNLLRPVANTASNMLNILGIGSMLSPANLIKGTVNSYQQLGQLREQTSMSNMAYEGSGIWDPYQQGLYYGMQNESIGLAGMTHGIIDPAQLLRNNLELNQNLVGQYGEGHDASAADMSKFALTNTLFGAAYGVSNSQMIQTESTLYKDLRMSVSDTQLALYQFASVAKQANVPVSDMLQTVSSLAVNFKSMGLNATEAMSGLMNGVVNHGMSLQDAASYATSMAQGFQKFGSNAGMMAYANMAYGGSNDPFSGPAMMMNMWKDNGQVNQAGLNQLAPLMAGWFNNVVIPSAGGNKNLESYLLMQQAQQQFGLNSQWSSVFARRFMEGGAQDALGLFSQNPSLLTGGSSGSADQQQTELINTISKATQNLDGLDQAIGDYKTTEMALASKNMSALDSFTGKIDHTVQKLGKDLLDLPWNNIDKLLGEAGTLVTVLGGIGLGLGALSTIMSGVMAGMTLLRATMVTLAETMGAKTVTGAAENAAADVALTGGSAAAGDGILSKLLGMGKKGGKWVLIGTTLAASAYAGYEGIKGLLNNGDSSQGGSSSNNPYGGLNLPFDPSAMYGYDPSTGDFTGDFSAGQGQLNGLYTALPNYNTGGYVPGSVSPTMLPYHGGNVSLYGGNTQYNSNTPGWQNTLTQLAGLGGAFAINKFNPGLTNILGAHLNAMGVGKIPLVGGLIKGIPEFNLAMAGVGGINDIAQIIQNPALRGSNMGYSMRDTLGNLASNGGFSGMLSPTLLIPGVGEAVEGVAGVADAIDSIQSFFTGHKVSGMIGNAIAGVNQNDVNSFTKLGLDQNTAMMAAHILNQNKSHLKGLGASDQQNWVLQYLNNAQANPGMAADKLAALTDSMAASNNIQSNIQSINQQQLASMIEQGKLLDQNGQVSSQAKKDIETLANTTKTSQEYLNTVKQTLGSEVYNKLVDLASSSGITADQMTAFFTYVQHNGGFDTTATQRNQQAASNIKNSAYQGNVQYLANGQELASKYADALSGMSPEMATAWQEASGKVVGSNGSEQSAITAGNRAAAIVSGVAMLASQAQKTYGTIKSWNAQTGAGHPNAQAADSAILIRNTGNADDNYDANRILGNYADNLGISRANLDNIIKKSGMNNEEFAAFLINKYGRYVYGGGKASGYVNDALSSSGINLNKDLVQYQTDAQMSQAQAYAQYGVKSESELEQEAMQRAYGVTYDASTGTMSRHGGIVRASGNYNQILAGLQKDNNTKKTEADKALQQQAQKAQIQGQTQAKEFYQSQVNSGDMSIQLLTKIGAFDDAIATSIPDTQQILKTGFTNVDTSLKAILDQANKIGQLVAGVGMVSVYGGLGGIDPRTGGGTNSAGQDLVYGPQLPAKSPPKTNNMWSLAQWAGKQLGWDPKVIYAQWQQETGSSFNSYELTHDNNFAGITWTGDAKNTPGGSMGTARPEGGNYVHYDSLADGVLGYVNFVLANDRYNNVKYQKGAVAQAQTIAADGWAVDPNYANALISLMGYGVNTNAVARSAGATTNLGGISSMPSVTNVGDVENSFLSYVNQLLQSSTSSGGQGGATGTTSSGSNSGGSNSGGSSGKSSSSGGSSGSSGSTSSSSGGIAPINMDFSAYTPYALNSGDANTSTIVDLYHDSKGNLISPSIANSGNASIGWSNLQAQARKDQSARTIQVNVDTGGLELSKLVSDHLTNTVTVAVKQAVEEAMKQMHPIIANQTAQQINKHVLGNNH